MKPPTNYPDNTGDDEGASAGRDYFGRVQLPSLYGQQLRRGVLIWERRPAAFASSNEKEH